MSRSRRNQKVFEAVTIALVGGILGTLIGSGGAIALGNVGIQLGSVADGSSLPINNTMRVSWTPQIAAISLVLSFVVATAGSALPALRAAAIQPVEAMRTRK